MGTWVPTSQTDGYPSFTTQTWVYHHYLEMNVFTMQGVRMEQWNTAAQDFQNLILLFRLD